MVLGGGAGVDVGVTAIDYRLLCVELSCLDVVFGHGGDLFIDSSGVRPHQG